MWQLIRVKPPPVLQQLGLMETSPRNHRRLGTWRQRAAQHVDRPDADLRFSPGRDRVKVRWSVVEEVHPNDDSKEA